MSRNIDEIVRRGERLEALQETSESLSTNAVVFNNHSRRVRRKMWWENTRVKMFIALAVIAVVYVIVTVSCGGFLWPKCVGSKNDTLNDNDSTSTSPPPQGVYF